MRRALALFVAITAGVLGVGAGSSPGGIRVAAATDHVSAVGSEPFDDAAAAEAYVDRLDAALREPLSGTGVEVARRDDGLRVTIPGSVLFGPMHSAYIRSDFFEVLDSIAKALTDFDRMSVLVTGHTDSTGSEAVNQPISQRRADTVASYLRSRKVAADRISSFGVGSRYPAFGNDTPMGRDQNRRVELDLVPDR